MNGRIWTLRVILYGLLDGFTSEHKPGYPKLECKWLFTPLARTF